MSTPLAIKQFSISQYDVPNGAMACTAISMVAGKRFLRQKGRARKCLWSDEKVAETIHAGVRLHQSWAQVHGGGRVADQASPDEIGMLAPLRNSLEMGECLFGHYGSTDLGYTLPQAIEAIKADLASDKQRRSAAAFVLTTQSHSTMIGVRRVPHMQSRGGDRSCPPQGSSAFVYKFTIFDSHTRDKETGLYVKGGKAVTVRLKDTRTLLSYLSRLYDTQLKPNEAFTLHEVRLPRAGRSANENEAVPGAASAPAGSYAALGSEKNGSFVSATSNGFIGSDSSSSVYSDDSNGSLNNIANPLRRLSKVLGLTAGKLATVSRGQGP